ncbi:MAG: DUF456 domain-containing protein [Bacteroidales bacterium]|nr:DUF456 domain-containing protein [Candidatus Cryptobacteroides aphodequi]
MDVFAILAIIAAVLGFLGSIFPGIPGPPLNWVSLLFVFFSDKAEMSLTFLGVWLAIVIGLTLIDYVVPAALTRVTGGHKAASTGAMIGLFAGIFFTPIGMIAGSLLGAFIGELIVADSDLGTSIKAAIGAFLGFILTTGVKLIASGVMTYYTFSYLFR